jgi:hypothetical protein
MNRLLLSTATTALLLSPLACDFEKTGSQLLAEKVMVGTLLSTPDVDVSLAAMAGMDAGTLPDGGFSGERITVPGQTTALVFFATRDGESGQPEPVTDATARIEFQNGSVLNLENKGLGTYGYTSDFNGDGGVKYQPGSTYRFVAAHGGSSHVGVVEEAPGLEQIVTLHPPEGYVRHTANQGLTLQRPAVPAGKERTLGFVTVFPLGKDGQKGQPTYTNIPKEPLEFLELVALPNESNSWKKSTIALPGSAFPQPDSNYLVVFQTAKNGGAESHNLFIGSTMIVGTADVGMVHTQ